jgi:hypothetical protein
MPDDPRPGDPVFLGGGSHPNRQFRELCNLAGIKPRALVNGFDGECPCCRRPFAGAS